MGFVVVVAATTHIHLHLRDTWHSCFCWAYVAYAFRKYLSIQLKIQQRYKFSFTL